MAYVPDPQFFVDRQEVYNLVKAKGCRNAAEIAQTYNYAQLLEKLFEFAKTFDCDPGYLADLLAVVDDAKRVSLGVYLDKTGSSVTNPKWLVNCNYTTVTVNQPISLEVVKGSHIITMVVDGNVVMPFLNIGSGARLETLDVKAGSCVDTLTIKVCPNPDTEVVPAILNKITADSCVNDYFADAGTTFGGFDCPSPFNVTT
jgi:hypothetical protein